MKKDLKEKFGFTLAEGATHVGIFHNTRRVGFTLAEVLITLGIIGIVSAMTIPTLVKNYQKKVLNTQFVQAYSILNQALRMTTSQYDYPVRCYYKSTDYEYELGALVLDECPNFHTKLLNNIKITKKCANNAIERGCLPEYKGYDEIINEYNPDREAPEGYSSYGEYESRGCIYFRKSGLKDIPVYNLNNGSILFLFNKSMPVLAVDVNGFAGPNKWGYDVFSFSIVNDGKAHKLGRDVCMWPEKGGVISLEKINEVIKGNY